LLGKTLWVSKTRAVAKNYPLYRDLMWNFADEECYIILPTPKYGRLSFTTKEFGSRMKLKLFDS